MYNKSTVITVAEYLPMSILYDEIREVSDKLGNNTIKKKSEWI